MFGDLIPEIPEFKVKIKEFHQDVDTKNITKPIILKNSIQETMFVESILAELNKRIDGRSNMKI